ncbi:MAG: hypothetical protein BRC29_00785 [Nanohaloarchaea archaeon SW_7_43_1]|nr:MAG: hypothetical protein BRC29_00785 [Nanohaloarchaea archaeon SW_7_43_1]
MISIVIPARNEKENLKDLLESIDQTTYDDYEVIVVDGGSTDGTKHVADKYDARVIGGPQEGPAVARNVGWENARGEFVYFLDADRLIGPKTLNNVAEAFEENSEVDVFHVETVDKFVTDNWVSKAIAAENGALTGKQHRAEIFRKLKEVIGL